MLEKTKKSSEIEEKLQIFYLFLLLYGYVVMLLKKGVNYNGARQEIRRTRVLGILFSLR